MSDSIIKVENVGKCYRLHHEKQERYTTLRDVMARKAKAIFRRKTPNTKPQGADEDFWALKDVNFEIKQGEAVGIIGRNGAGKSTLLKILSRITEPTTGRITLRGRVASLLEVGTGFHPELTGHENIFLNGAILGMRKDEIKAKFDEIVDFAGVEMFLDTPVKRYSSGMYVRLAFAVAAHLEPEILVVDEVLAVGDAEFQRKCLGRMNDVAKGGRTVIFVSHNMSLVQRLCSKAILLKDGKVEASGYSPQVIGKYLTLFQNEATRRLDGNISREGNGALRFISYSLRNQRGENTAATNCGEAMRLSFEYECPSGNSATNVSVSLRILGQLGDELALLGTDIAGANFATLPAKGTVTINFPRLPLPPGSYRFNLLAAVQGSIADWIRDVGQFQVEGGDFYGTGKVPSQQDGAVLIDHSWSAN